MANNVPMRAFRSLATVAAAGLVAGTAALALPTAATAAAAPLPSSLPSWASTAKVLGATPASQPVFVSFALKGKDPVGEAAYGREATTPGSPLYRHWLTKDQFEQRYGALPGAAAGVTSALKALGVTNVMTDRMGLGVLAVLPASVASTVFSVHFHQLAHGSQSLRVPTTEPKLPAALTPFVSSFSGLTEHPLHTILSEEGPTVPALPVGGAPTAYFNAQPASTYYGSKLATDKPPYKVLAGDTSTIKPYATSGYTPPQLRGAYGVDKVKQTGKGVTVGVALFYSGPDVGSDLATFSKAFHLAAPNYTDLSPENQAVSIGAGSVPIITPIDAASEQTLDVEAIHQMAPDAAIDYSGALAPYNEAIYVALDTLIAAGVAEINNSYGSTGDTDAANAAVFQTLVTGPAMTMGVGLNYSSGDAADNVLANGQREVDFPASSDEVTSVGGTLLKVGQANDYQGEAYWGTYSSPALGNAKTWGPIASQPAGAGGGGGVSTAYAEPSYQQGVVPAEETQNKDTGTTAPGRVVPDVSMLGDSTTGILVGETQQPDVNKDGSTPDITPEYSYYRIGGTSVSSPLFTGVMALVDQALGTSAGFVNPTIYPFLRKHPGAFRDPQIGRKPGGSRLGSSAADLKTGCTGSAANGDLSCVGSGPGAVPVLAEVRSDYTDSANNGIATATTDPVTGLVTVGSTPGNPVIFHLRGQGVLGTLEDLPGYDDSTGLGSPYAPAFVAAFTGKAAGTGAAASPASSPSSSPVPSPRPGAVGSLPTTGADPLLPLVATVLVAAAGAATVLRRRFR
jgi:subtilase family serine protease